MDAFCIFFSGKHLLNKPRSKWSLDVDIVEQIGVYYISGHSLKVSFSHSIWIFLSVKRI